MKKHFFWFQYHLGDLVIHRAEAIKGSKFENSKEERIELALEGKPLPMNPLEFYLRTRGLNKYRKRLRMIRLKDRTPVHFWYVPQSGDVISITLDGRGGSE
jgi:hypothetical protein